MRLSSDFAKRFEKLPVKIFEEVPDAAGIIVDEIIRQSRKKALHKNNLVLALGAASACAPVYEAMVNACKAKKLSFKNIVVFTMSEFYPLGKNELQTHYRFMKEYLFDLVDIPMENIHCLESEEMENVNEYCEKFEKLIEKCGGIDMVIESQMGMNEPGSTANSITRQITLNYNTRLGAASEFFGIKDVPLHALTMGISTILKAKKIYFLAWGDGAAQSVKNLVEGEISAQNPSSFLLQHLDVNVFIDESASAKLTRIDTPWLADTCEWDDYLTRKAVFWLCMKLNKPILKLTDRDYNDNGMSDLITVKGPASALNIKVFNDLQHTISGWPGGKPNADDSTRPERAQPYPKRVVVFSPHPDDDVISMGGTVARLSEQGHEVHLAYETSGNIAVFDHDVIRYLDFIRESSPIYNFDQKTAEKYYHKVVAELAKKHPGEADPMDVRQIKTIIRRGEARSACRFLGIPDERINFLELPFYETGGVKKNPLTRKDIDIVKSLLQRVKPHQIFLAGDLADPHGTHRVCFVAVITACKELRDEPWFKDCRVWMYRGAWQEWPVEKEEMAVPLSPEEVKIKREAIFKHQSQKDLPLFPGTDMREFWVRAEERNHNTAVLFDKLGMAEYQAIELFVQYKFD
ncbi:MAG: PIG-L family deacetylase [Bacteroidales bacterium]|jgi:glucosamine-6-phosphate deaminase|nr:PIG-L family deacetylase [Bacteroidales bacterium]